MNASRQISFGERPLLSGEAVVAEALFVGLLRAAGHLSAGLEELFKSHGLTGPQYNALRVLRDAGECGLPCQELGAALITRDPDITRMADRLEEHGYLLKRRSCEDRRVVLLSLTPRGLEILSELDGPLAALHQGQMARLTPAEQRELLRLLERLQGPTRCGGATR